MEQAKDILVKSLDKVLNHEDDDKQFRRGAAHAAHWLVEQIEKKKKELYTPDEIFSHLSDLHEVLEDWRNRRTDSFDDKNPWEWSDGQLSDYIYDNRKRW